jgi:hypothetical protein
MIEARELTKRYGDTTAVHPGRSARSHLPEYSVRSPLTRSMLDKGRGRVEVSAQVSARFRKQRQAGRFAS